MTLERHPVTILYAVTGSKSHKESWSDRIVGTRHFSDHFRLTELVSRRCQPVILGNRNAANGIVWPFFVLAGFMLGVYTTLVVQRNPSTHLS